MSTRTAFPGTITTSTPISADNNNELPGGWTAHDEITANVTGITADGDITGVSETATLVAGRRYKVSAIGHLITTSTGGQVRLNIMDGGTRIQLFGVQCGSGGANGVITAAPWTVVNGDGASHTFTAYIDIQTAGTYSAIASSEFPIELLVEDLGPSS